MTDLLNSLLIDTEEEEQLSLEALLGEDDFDLSEALYDDDDDATNMVSLETFLDASIGFANDLLLEEAGVLEGLFGPKPVDKLLDKFQKKVDRKCKSAEKCDEMLAALKTEADKYNQCLSAMKKAAQKYKAGQIDKKELKAQLTPVLKELRQYAKLLSLRSVVGDKKNVTDEEIKNVRDFIIGARKIVNTKKQTLKTGNESVLNFLNEDEDLDLDSDFNFEEIFD